jgi:uncharacterized phage protein (TIGR02220 family)
MINKCIEKSVEEEIDFTIRGDNDILPALFSNSGNPVMNNNIMQITQDMQASIIFSELLLKNIYYSNILKIDEDGYFFYTIKDMENKFFIGRTAQNRILKVLEDLQLIHRKQKINKQGTAGRYFKVNFSHPVIENIKLQYIKGQKEEEEMKRGTVDLLGNSISDYSEKKARKVSKAPEDVKRITRTAIRYLNQLTRKRYKEDSPYNMKFIENLLKQGYTEYDIYAVTYEQYIEWNTSDKMKKYLRPSTLYGNGKFDKYLENTTKLAYSISKFLYINQISTEEGRIKEMTRLLTDDIDMPDYTWMDMYDSKEVKEAKRRAEELNPYKDIVF